MQINCLTTEWEGNGSRIPLDQVQITCKMEDRTAHNKYLEEISTSYKYASKHHTLEQSSLEYTRQLCLTAEYLTANTKQLVHCTNLQVGHSTPSRVKPPTPTSLLRAAERPNCNNKQSGAISSTLASHVTMRDKQNKGPSPQLPSHTLFQRRPTPCLQNFEHTTLKIQR